MPQVAVYMKNDLYDRVIFRAKEQGVSVSRLVRHDNRASQRLSLNIEKAVYDKARAEAKRRKTSLSAYVREIMIRYWKPDEVSL